MPPAAWNAASTVPWPSFFDLFFVLQPVDDGRTIFDVALGMFRLHMGESEGTSHSQHGVGDHERPVRVARDPAEAEIRLPIALHHPIGTDSGGIFKSQDLCSPQIMRFRDVQFLHRRQPLRRNYGSSVLISPQRRKWAEMCNDPNGFVPRKCEYDAHKKTRHAGDCVATQTGHDKGWDGARPPLATDFRAQSSLCSLSDRLSSAGVSLRACLAKKKSATDGFRPRRPRRPRRFADSGFEPAIEFPAVSRTRAGRDTLFNTVEMRVSYINHTSRPSTEGLLGRAPGVNGAFASAVASEGFGAVWDASARPHGARSAPRSDCIGDYQPPRAALACDH